MEGDTRRVRKAAEVVGREMKVKAGDRMERLAEEFMQKGSKPKELFGIGDGMIEGIYNQAYQLYNAGRYREAVQFFRMLITLNNAEPRYLMGMAASLHMLKDYVTAAHSYAACSILDPGDPVSHFHASDCYIEMGNSLAALIALEMAIKRAGDKPQYATLKDRASMTVESLKKKLAERQQ